MSRFISFGLSESEITATALITCIVLFQIFSTVFFEVIRCCLFINGDDSLVMLEKSFDLLLMVKLECS